MDYSYNIMDIDVQSILVKKRNFKDVIYYYSCFGWQVAEVMAEGTIESVVEIKFFRPHNINEKDELQYLQACLERDLIALGKADLVYKRKKTRHSKVIKLMAQKNELKQSIMETCQKAREILENRCATK